MDIPFPEATPRFIDSKWFSADSPCDEEAELTALEASNQTWFKFISLQLSSIGQQYKARAPLGKTDPEPMEECESEEEEDSVQIVEDSDTAEEEPPNLNTEVDLLQIMEDSDHELETGNLYTEAELIEILDGEDSDNLGSSPVPVPMPLPTEALINPQPCTCDGGTSRECNYRRISDIGNDESDESEESHDEDEEEELQQAYPPPRNHNEQQGRTLDLTDSSEPNMSDQSTLWP